MAIYNFKVKTSKTRMKRVAGKREVYTEDLELEVGINITGTDINLGYGYKHWVNQCTEGADSVLAGEKYDIHWQLLPKENDTWYYKDREFKVGKVSGFLNFTAPLLENGKQVATIHFEDYYKD